MRHKAPRSLVDWWRRVPPTTARLVGGMAGQRPFHALVAVLVTMGLGAGAYVAVTSASGASSSEPTVMTGSTPPGETGPSGPTDESEPPHPTDEVPASDGTPASGGGADPGASGRPETAVPATAPPSTDVTPSSLTGRSPETESPSTGTSTPSTSPEQTSASASVTPEDVTPPDTSLAAEFPEPDVGEFWLSANEPASFACSLDEAAYTPCGPHTLLSDLSPGWHTLAVRATDAAGNSDPSPAETSWHATAGGSSDQ